MLYLARETLDAAAVVVTAAISREALEATVAVSGNIIPPRLSKFLHREVVGAPWGLQSLQESERLVLRLRQEGGVRLV